MANGYRYTDRNGLLKKESTCCPNGYGDTPQKAIKHMIKQYISGEHESFEKSKKAIKLFNSYSGVQKFININGIVALDVLKKSGIAHKESYKDTYAIRCSVCNTVFGSLAHLNKYGKRICNKCCPTSKYDSDDIFIGCDCMKRLGKE